jgi:CheY-like chemotaxis protein
VLVVDDNTDAADSLALLLRLSGYEVHIVHDGPACLEAVQAYRPHAILLDIGLPGMDGYAVARRLREQPGSRDVLLVAVSGYGQEDDLARSRQAGFDYHLVKPVEFSALERLLPSFAARAAAPEARPGQPAPQ